MEGVSGHTPKIPRHGHATDRERHSHCSDRLDTSFLGTGLSSVFLIVSVLEMGISCTHTPTPCSSLAISSPRDPQGSRLSCLARLWLGNKETRAAGGGWPGSLPGSSPLASVLIAASWSQDGCHNAFKPHAQVPGRKKEGVKRKSATSLSTPADESLAVYPP